MSISTPEYFSKFNYLDTIERNYETDMNFLFQKALTDIAVIPAAYVALKIGYDIEINGANITSFKKHAMDLQLVSFIHFSSG